MERDFNCHHTSTSTSILEVVVDRAHREKTTQAKSGRVSTKISTQVHIPVVIMVTKIYWKENLSSD